MQSCSSCVNLPIVFRLPGITPVFTDLGEEGVNRSWVACSNSLAADDNDDGVERILAASQGSEQFDLVQGLN
jgi:hypothetical protein